MSVYTQSRPAPPSSEDMYTTDFNALGRKSEALFVERWNDFPPLQKVFYTELPEIAKLSDSEVTAIRSQNNNIQVKRIFNEDKSIDVTVQKPIPRPVRTFTDAFADFPEILGEIQKAGFDEPTPIQKQSWPILLSGEDMIGIAQTGTGKTLAFILPALIHIEGQTMPRSDRRGPTVLVMAPTRELALQIEREVNKYQYRGIKTACIYGGADRRAQVRLMEAQDIDVVIATPGRLSDLVRAGVINLDYISYVVLDEADRMLDMGFEPQIRVIMYDIRRDRQTVLTSATWPPGVRALAKSYSIDPVQVYVGSLDLTAASTVTQNIVMVEDDDEKYEIFKRIVFGLAADEKLVCFCGRKFTVSNIASELAMMGLNIASIQSDYDQYDREEAIRMICDGSVNVLIATDVASRGIDIPDVTHVINYDFPKQMEEYVHRIGRTGRAGKTGEAISFVGRENWGIARELIQILQKSCQEVPPELEDMARRYKEKMRQKEEFGRAGGGRGGGGGYRGGGRRNDEYGDFGGGGGRRGGGGYGGGGYSGRDGGGGGYGGRDGGGGGSYGGRDGGGSYGGGGGGYGVGGGRGGGRGRGGRGGRGARYDSGY